jgi:hypothetical protein
VEYLQTLRVQFVSGIGNVLSWSTAIEINNDRFEIYRRNGDDEFEKIGFKKGKGNSTEETVYQFEDQNFKPGWNYYYLVQRDFDGASEASQMVSIFNNEDKKEQAMTAWPNPTTGKVNLRLAKGGKGEYTVHSSIGAIVKSGSFDGQTEIEIPGYTGLYMIIINSEGEFWSQQLVKVE